MKKINSTVFLFEHPKDIEILKANLEESDTVIALNQYADFELEKNNIQHLLFEGDVYLSKEFYDDLYYASANHLFKLLPQLDECLFEIDERFKTENFNVFYLFYNYFYYLITPWFIFIYDIQKLCENNEVKKIKIIINEFIEKKEKIPSCFYPKEFSIYNCIVKELREIYHYKIEETVSNIPFKNENEQNKIEIKEKNIFQNIKNFLNIKRIKYFLKIEFLKVFAKYKILNCLDNNIRSIKSELIKKGFKIIDFPEEEFKNNFDSYSKKNEFIASIETKLRDLFVFRNVNYFHFIKPKLLEFIEYLENLYYHYKQYEKYISKNKFDIVIFLAHCGWLIEKDYLVTLLPILKKYKIPYITWAHGIYGLNTAIQVFQDMPHCQNYFVCGSLMAENLKKVWQRKDINYFIAGQPRIERYYELYRKNDLSKQKKKILYLAWSDGEYNRQILRIIKPYMRYSLWTNAKKIIDFLNLYSKEFVIEIRPQIESLGELYKNYITLKNYNLLICEQSKSFYQCISEADIIIVHTISTHSVEAAFSKADIFLFEDCEIDDKILSVIEKRMFVYKNLDEMFEGLQSYLKNKNFYQKSNDIEFLNKIIDFSNFKNRTNIITENLLKILEAKNNA